MDQKMFVGLVTKILMKVLVILEINQNNENDGLHDFYLEVQDT